MKNANQDLLFKFKIEMLTSDFSHGKSIGNAGQGKDEKIDVASLSYAMKKGIDGSTLLYYPMKNCPHHQHQT
jgi:hypothetical protein